MNKIVDFRVILKKFFISIVLLFFVDFLFEFFYFEFNFHNAFYATFSFHSVLFIVIIAVVLTAIFGRKKSGDESKDFVEK